MKTGAKVLQIALFEGVFPMFVKNLQGKKEEAWRFKRQASSCNYDSFARVCFDRIYKVYRIFLRKMGVNPVNLVNPVKNP